MATYISYTNRTDRDAVLDLTRWLGFSKSLMVFKYLRYYAQPHIPEDKQISEMNRMSFMLEMAGVSGHPVRRLFARFFGEAKLELWLAS